MGGACCRAPVERPGVRQPRQAIFTILTWGPAEVERYRDETLYEVKVRKAKLQPGEDKFRSEMHPDVARVLRGKSLLLLREELNLIGWQDKSLFSDLVGGMPIVGDMPVTGVFPPRVAEAQASVEELMMTASVAQEAVKRPKETDMEQATETWKTTMEEAAGSVGWLRGPSPSRRL